MVSNDKEDLRQATLQKNRVKGIIYVEVGRKKKMWEAKKEVVRKKAQNRNLIGPFKTHAAETSNHYLSRADRQCRATHGGTCGQLETATVRIIVGGANGSQTGRTVCSCRGRLKGG